jgi:hypothetical protein
MPAWAWGSTEIASHDDDLIVANTTQDAGSTSAEKIKADLHAVAVTRDGHFLALSGKKRASRSQVKLTSLGLASSPSQTQPQTSEKCLDAIAKLTAKASNASDESWGSYFVKSAMCQAGGFENQLPAFRTQLNLYLWTQEPKREGAGPRAGPKEYAKYAKVLKASPTALALGACDYCAEEKEVPDKCTSYDICMHHFDKNAHCCSGASLVCEASSDSNNKCWSRG